MKFLDFYYINFDSYYFFADIWKEEWEKGVQVLVSLEIFLQFFFRYLYVCVFGLGNECFYSYFCVVWGEILSS